MCAVSGKRNIICFCILLIALFLLVLLSLVYGPVDISLRQLMDAFLEPGGEDVSRQILWNLRIPRVIAALLAGVSLAVSGLSLQTVFRNPLCGPFVLGISGGASLGVALAMLAGFSFGRFGVVSAASIGAFLVTLIVMWVANRFERNSVILVAGLLFGYFIDALVSVIIAHSDAESLRVFVSWGMGSFGRLTLDDSPIFIVVVLAGLALIASSMRYLNAVCMGDDFARGLGLRVSLSKKMVLLGASILAGAATAFCGPVAFIGIAVPHLAFLIFKTTNHRVLLPGAALCGAMLALIAGLFPVSVPLNAVLSIVGVPVILYVLLCGNRAGRH